MLGTNILNATYAGEQAAMLFFLTWQCFTGGNIHCWRTGERLKCGGRGIYTETEGRRVLLALVDHCQGRNTLIQPPPNHFLESSTPHTGSYYQPSFPLAEQNRKHSCSRVMAAINPYSFISPSLFRSLSQELAWLLFVIQPRCQYSVMTGISPEVYCLQVTRHSAFQIAEVLPVESGLYFTALECFKRSLTEICSSRHYIYSVGHSKQNKCGCFCVIAVFVVVISLKSLDNRTEQSALQQCSAYNPLCLPYF